MIHAGGYVLIALICRFQFQHVRGIDDPPLVYIA